MPRLTQKNLIEQIRVLKGIKPRQEWVILAKSQIFNETEPKMSVRRISISDVISNFKFQISNSFSRRLAYSFATLLLVIVGLVGFAQHTMPGDLLFPIRKVAEQSQAALSGQTGIKQGVATLNNRINDLAQVAKQGKKDNIPSAISEVNAKASELAKALKENPVEDAGTLKEIAVSLRVLANVPGADLSETPAVNDLYQTVVENQIADLTEATLTDEQASVLLEAEELYGQQDYVGALERILSEF